MRYDVCVEDAEKKVHGEWDSSLDFDMQKSTKDPMDISSEVQRDTPEPTMNEDQAFVVNPGRTLASLRHGQHPAYSRGSKHSSEAEPTIIPESNIESAYALTPGILISPLPSEPGFPATKENDIKITLERPISQV
jgi:hypothetical protein